MSSTYLIATEQELFKQDGTFDLPTVKEALSSVPGNSLHALIAGPGNGKTTLGAACFKDAYLVVPESARAVMRRNAIYGGPHPSDPEQFVAFQRQVVAEQIVYEQAIRKIPRNVLLDHTLITGMGYFLAFDRAKDIPDDLWAIYHLGGYSTIHAMDPLPYKNDDVRWENGRLAAKIHSSVIAAHQNAGYRITHVPVYEDLPFEQSVERRKQFVLNNITALTSDKPSRLELAVEAE